MGSRPKAEAGALKMAVERKGLRQPFFPHQNKRYAVGETNLLIGELFKKRQGFQLVFVGGSNDGKPFGKIDAPGALPRKTVPHAAAQKGEHFIQNKIACQTNEFLSL